MKKTKKKPKIKMEGLFTDSKMGLVNMSKRTDSVCAHSLRSHDHRNRTEEDLKNKYVQLKNEAGLRYTHVTNLFLTRKEWPKTTVFLINNCCWTSIFFLSCSPVVELIIILLVLFAFGLKALKR